MIYSYNPNKAPNPKEWLALDEQERIDLIYSYHFNQTESTPDLQMHAVVHNIVENQIAMGDRIPVKKTLNRLMNEGLDRHMAIHAIGSELVEYMFNVSQDGPGGGHTEEEYFENLKTLTASGYIEKYG